MPKAGKEVGFWSAVAMGIGAMVGAGIFALIGLQGWLREGLKRRSVARAREALAALCGVSEP